METRRSEMMAGDIRRSAWAAVAWAILFSMVCAGCVTEQSASVSSPPSVADSGRAGGAELDGGTAQWRVGPEGGEVTHSGATLRVPAGAVSESVTLTITPLPGELPCGVLRGYELGPDGTVFQEPVHLTLSGLPPLEADGNYEVVFMDDGVCKPMPDSYSVAGAGEAGTRLRHLSRYGVVKRTFIEASERLAPSCECTPARQSAFNNCCADAGGRPAVVEGLCFKCDLSLIRGPEDIPRHYSEMWSLLTCEYEGEGSSEFTETAHGACVRRCCENPLNPGVHTMGALGYKGVWSFYDGDNLSCALPAPPAPPLADPGYAEAYLDCISECPAPEGAPCGCPVAADGTDQVRCGSECRALASDPANCGACGVVCDAGQMCSGGVCRDGKWPGPCTVGDGFSRTTYTYDANGNLLSEEWDGNADGTVDSRTTYTNDENGNRLTAAYDTDADGTVDERRRYTYDANGNLLSEEIDYADLPGLTTRTTFSYDADGNLQTMEVYRAGDGGALSERVTYTYDANGNLLTSTATGGSRRTYTYGCWE